MRRSNLPPSAFTTKHLIRGFEGGAIYVAEREGKYYVIVDEAALVDMLSAEDREQEEAVRVLEFDTAEEFNGYLEARRWKP